MSTIRVNRFENTSGVGFGSCVQIANYTTSALASGTVTTPVDDTVPQSTEGNEFLTLAFTPKSATNKLKITVNLFVTNSNAGSVTHTLALHQDSTANALAATTQSGSASFTACMNLVHYMTAGTTSATTFKVRVGANAAGTEYLNGSNVGSRLYGGVSSSSITIEEYQV